MKQIAIAFIVIWTSLYLMAGEHLWTDPKTNITWEYDIKNGGATLSGGSDCDDGEFWTWASVSRDTQGDIVVPAVINGYPVKSIGEYAFDECNKITSITLPDSVTVIDHISFFCCRGVTNVTIPTSVTYIGRQAFTACVGLKKIIIPASVKTIAYSAFQSCNGLTNVVIPSGARFLSDNAFDGCSNLKSITIDGNAPTNWSSSVFAGTSPELVVHVNPKSSGWITWNGMRVAMDAVKNGDATVEAAALTVTNVVVHYVVNSIQPEKAIPASMDTGFVNVITEIKSGGAVSVPATWMVNYPNYVAKFGIDFTKSLMKPTGKKDGAGNAMLVWQDYVAGTDPTDENDVFTASITTDTNGKLLISYTPELSDAEKAKRIYKILGKVKLTDSDWTGIPAGHEADYNFFKVSVEMK